MQSVPRWRHPALMLLAFAATSSRADNLPGQPFVSYWYPSTILTWDPASDPDAPFNRSNVPLAPRFQNPDFNVNAHAHPDEARISALVWSGITVFFAGFALLLSLIIPMPPPRNAPDFTIYLVRAALFLIYGLPCGIGTWWLVLFT